MNASKVLRSAAAAQRTPMIQFIGKRHAPEHAASGQPQAHPAAPSQSLPSTFKEYREKATQHGPLSVGTQATGRIGGATGESLGPVEPPKGIAFDRDDLPQRFKRMPWTLEEIEAVESGGASAFA